MTTARFVPFRSAINDVIVLQNRLNSIFHDFARPDGSSETLTTSNFVPAVDAYEDEARLAITLEVPGIPQNDLDVRVENQTLTVRGERKFAPDEKEENFHRIERRFGTFVRSFTLPQTVDTTSVAASANAGLLRIEMKKKEAAKPRSVKIDVAGQPEAPKQVEASAS